MRSFALIPILVALASLSVAVSAAPFQRIKSNPIPTSGFLISPSDSTNYPNSNGDARLTLQYQKISSSSLMTVAISASLVPVGSGIHTPGQTIRLPKFSKTFGSVSDVIVGTFGDLYNVCGRYSKFFFQFFFLGESGILFFSRDLYFLSIFLRHTY